MEMRYSRLTYHVRVNKFSVIGLANTPLTKTFNSKHLYCMYNIIKINYHHTYVIQI